MLILTSKTCGLHSKITFERFFEIGGWCVVLCILCVYVVCVVKTKATNKIIYRISYLVTKEGSAGVLRSGTLRLISG